MRCVQCGTENRPDRKFCAECGAALARGCPSCGSANLPGERFCGECGTPLGPGTVPAVAPGSLPGTVPAAAEGSLPAGAGGGAAERRLVSVLFADIVGSTQLAEARDPEATRELLATYFEAARSVIERYGGAVEKFIGDAVMAVWGAPVAHEDDAERAVRAGLDLVDAVVALGERTAIRDLAARAAVLTGEAAVTVGARDQGLVAGDLVNSAARLQSVAAPGAVLVGEATERATRDAIAYEVAGDHVVKGKALPIAAWRAMRIVAGRRGYGRTDRLEAPFVGRAAELRALKDALAATGADRRPRHVAIIGQAGIGKSRLAWELEKYVDGLVETVYWHHGRSPSYGDGIAFWALTEMVRGRARILETDLPSDAAGKLAAMLAEYVPDAEDRRWIEPHLRALLGLEQAPAGDRSEQFGAWRRFFERVAERGTAVLVFEDLQWADDGLLDFVDSLFEWSRTSPILVVTLTRPELLERRPTLASASRSAVALHLDPLRADDMRELLSGLAPEMAADLVTAVVERAEGIPLYAIELVRMLRDDGADGLRGGETRTAAGRLAIPASLQALVAARLDALDPADRSLLQDASVLGQTFTIPGLAAVAGEEPATLEPRLRGLVRREFLGVEADPRSPERGQYGFVQSVVHEVAYGTLARRDRRTRHLAAARYVDSLDDESMATVVATHYLEAYRAAPDDEQGRVIRAQARVALRAAAERSARLHNYAQAVRDLERSLELTDEATERAAILVQQAELSEAGASYDEAAATAERAREAFERLGDRRAALQSTALLGRIQMKRGDWTGAAALLERGLAGLDPAADPETYARFAAEFARTFMIRNLVDEGAAWTERALAAAGPSRHVEIVAEAMNTRGVCLAELGRRDEGIALIRGSIELAAAHHASGAELRARFNLAGRVFDDDPRAAAEVLRTGVEVARRTGRRDWLIACALALAGTVVNAELGYDEGLAVLGVVEDQELPPEARAEVITVRAQIDAYRGDRTAWPRAIAEARRLAAGSSNTQRQWQWATTAADVALAEGRLDDAAREADGIAGNWEVWRYVTQGHAAIRAHDPAAARVALGGPPLQQEKGTIHAVDRMAFAAGIAALEGRRDEAVAQYREALRLARQIGLSAMLADHLLSAVIALGRDDPETPALAAEARALWEGAGDHAHLDRLDEALAGGESRARAAEREGELVGEAQEPA